MAFTNYILGPIARRLFGETPNDITPPDSLWAGLATTEPPLSGLVSSGYEFSYSGAPGYQRIDATGYWTLTRDVEWVFINGEWVQVDTDQIVTNAVQLEWPVATQNWPTINYLFLATSSIVGDGAIIAIGRLWLPVDVVKGKSYTAKVNTVRIKLY